MGELLDRGGRRLLASAAGPPAREAYLLLGHLLRCDEAHLRAREEVPVDPETSATFDALVDRRGRGEPVAYLLGRREFYGREFQVDPRVLIPRPESEHLVEAALELPLPPRPRFLDVGTGSGCLAVTLALELAGSTGVATDRHPGALAVARANAHALGAHRLVLAAGDLAGSLRLPIFDLVVANLPYVAPDAPDLEADVRAFEPAAALFAEEGGLALVRGLLAQLRALRPGTPVVLEIGYDQADAVRSDASRAGFEVVEIRRDYAGHSRIVILERMGASSG